MVSLRKGSASDALSLAPLILSSADLLLPFLFKGEEQALDYLYAACSKQDGQYSAYRHDLVIGQNEDICGCITLWHHDMSAQFKQATVKSLQDCLSAIQVSHLLAVNPQLNEVFAAPQVHELCIGHLAVLHQEKGQGIGKKLIAHAIKQAKFLSKTSLVLDVDGANDEACSFYDACGFVPTKSTEFSPTEQVFLRMQYAL